ncbi:S-type anion channel SLAH3-like isoform X2 [Wolffia australiana]
MGSQSVLWKTLSKSHSTEFKGISPAMNLLVWGTTLLLLAILSLAYALKTIFYFKAIQSEFYHPVRMNFFFAPFVACLFIVLGLPPSIPLDLMGNAGPPAWYILMAPILCLELKIYGQWMFGGRRRLSKVANPSNHLSIVGNFVGALLGASLGLKEGPIFFFSVGLSHYAVLLVTLYQRLPTNEALPKELHPVFFLFVAVPNAAAMAWAKIEGTFDYFSRIPFFLGLFLYTSLVVRLNFFRGFRFSLAWWAYTFPMTDAAVAAIWYAAEVRNPVTQSLSLFLSGVSTVTTLGLLISTIVHAFFGDLFPNDPSIGVNEIGLNLPLCAPTADIEPISPVQLSDPRSDGGEPKPC